MAELMRVFNPIPPRFSSVAKQVIRCAEKVHERLGPGLVQPAYKSCLGIELSLAEIAFEQDVHLSLIYADVAIHQAMQLDYLVEEAVVVTVICAEAILPIHEAQMKTHLRFSELRIGLIFNFDVISMKQGVKKILT